MQTIVTRFCNSRTQVSKMFSVLHLGQKTRMRALSCCSHGVAFGPAGIRQTRCLHVGVVRRLFLQDARRGSRRWSIKARGVRGDPALLLSRPLPPRRVGI